MNSSIKAENLNSVNHLYSIGVVRNKHRQKILRTLLTKFSFMNSGIGKCGNFLFPVRNSRATGRFSIAECIADLFADCLTAMTTAAN